jgi:hypothetical protein
LHWNYRVIRRYETGLNDIEEPYYSLCEVYYNDDDSIMGYIDSEASPHGESLNYLKADILWMLDACEKPILDSRDLEEYFEHLRQNPEYGPEEPYVTYSIEELMEGLDGE